jgi:biopolymer transport protein ExbB/TolQ/predicted  nucleic acid-binding Zn-ribbon protein
VKFKCPTCETQLNVEPEMAGKLVRCPGCDSKLQIPAGGLPAPSSLPAPSGFSAPDLASAPAGAPASEAEEHAQAPTSPDLLVEQNRNARGGWEESDPTNPNPMLAFGIGFVIFLVWIGVLYPFKAPDGTAAATYTPMQFIASLFFKHALVSFTNTLFFTWSMAILYLKLQKLNHQKKALLLDVLPWELGSEINRDNVSQFIDHLYRLPHRLRDSMMVNRIRKALELFEVKQNTGDVTNMLSSQSDIDGMRIGGSFSQLKAFLWAIPILGFIGTVIGLSHAISGMNFAGMSDLKEITNTLGNVTGGLGTAFDATLLGLVFALGLNFPLNAMTKAEDDCLNDIDAFCNEVLLPRLNDGGSIAGGSTEGIMDTLVKAVANAQKEFLIDLNTLSAKIAEQAANLDRRATEHQARVDREFATALTIMREKMTESVTENVNKTSEYIRALASGIQSLNGVLSQLGEKQILIHQVKKKGWFSRSE